jgi:alpha-beta hydrolase superfamily lysophospholipase
MLPRLSALTLAVPLAAVALIMLFAPGVWYAHFPGAAEAGPLNPQLVRLLGCAFAVGACVLATYAARRDDPPASALVAFSAFAGLYALVHLWSLERLNGHSWSAMLLRDLPAVHIPAALTLWFAASALAKHRARRPAPPELFRIGEEIAHGTPIHTLWRR